MKENICNNNPKGAAEWLRLGASRAFLRGGL
jgi:hypothetical protein